MKYEICKKVVVEVSKEEYIRDRENTLKKLKQSLTTFKIQTTKMINKKQNRIDEIQRELSRIK